MPMNQTMQSRMYATHSSIGVVKKHNFVKETINEKYSPPLKKFLKTQSKAIPLRKQAFFERLHKKDMQHDNLCELKGFGDSISVKHVRDRAIGERIEAISSSN